MFQCINIVKNVLALGRQATMHENLLLIETLFFKFFICKTESQPIVILETASQCLIGLTCQHTYHTCL